MCQKNNLQDGEFKGACLYKVVYKFSDVSKVISFLKIPYGIPKIDITYSA